MTTSLAIDKKLVETAYRISGLRTKKEAVVIALEEFIQRHKNEELIAMFSSVNYDADYDYKGLRCRE